MKRREFLRLVSASVAAAAIPVTLVKAAGAIFPQPEFQLADNIEWYVMRTDYDFAVNIAGRIRYGDEEFGNAVMVRKSLKLVEQQDIDQCKQIIMENLAKKIEQRRMA